MGKRKRVKNTPNVKNQRLLERDGSEGRMRTPQPARCTVRRRVAIHYSVLCTASIKWIELIYKLFIVFFI